MTELANVAGVSRTALNVELARLRRQEIIAKYAHGLYGLPDAVSPQALVSAIDSHAYITGHYALYGYGLLTQVPVTITCFTDRRSLPARERATPVGRLVFVCVRSRVYFLPSAGAIAPPAQALCDYVYLSRRRGHRRKPWSLSGIFRVSAMPIFFAFSRDTKSACRRMQNDCRSWKVAMEAMKGSRASLV